MNSNGPARPGEHLVFVVWAYTAEEPYISVCDTEIVAEEEADMAAIDCNIPREDFHVEMLAVQSKRY